ncbi:unnamed protein product [Penicillium nalgiovense]|nr:unnamed protein product [Penicillium nalgiovense]
MWLDASPIEENQLWLDPIMSRAIVLCVYTGHWTFNALWSDPQYAYRFVLLM